MSQTVPSTIPKWKEEVLGVFGTAASDLSLADIGRHQRPVGSASKLGFNDWLLLRVIRKVEREAPSHEAIFGTHGGRIKADSAKLLSRSDWWHALREDKNPWAWNRMQPWKQSANEIVNRPTDSKGKLPGPVGLEIGSDRVVVETIKERLRRPAIKPDNAAERPNQLRLVEEKMERMDLYAEVSPSRSPSPPSDAGSRYASSGSPGNLAPGRDAISLDSSIGLEAKLLARHRPDEALVNMSCILLLQGILNAVTGSSYPPKYDWSILHKTCTISQLDSSSNPVPLITAKMDGCLVFRNNKLRTEECDVLSIVEVKPFRRDVNKDATRMQEGAEMAAWIATEPVKGLLPAPINKYRRLLISQDLDEIVITVAEYDDMYIDYICAGRKSEHPRGRPLDPSPSRPPVSSSSNLAYSSSSVAVHTTASHTPSRNRVPSSSSSSGGRLSSRSGRSSSPESRSATMQALYGRPSGSSALPVTPQRQTYQGQGGRQQTPAGGPGAPRRREAGPITSTDGFLIMTEYRGLRIGDPRQLEEAVLLLASLMTELCTRDKPTHLDFGQRQS